MIDASTWLLFAAASAAIVAVPGPTVTVIVANSLRGGARLGLANVLGTQAGLALMIVLLAAGFEPLIANLGPLFEVLRVIGAAYLIWLGVGMLRSDGSLGVSADGVQSLPSVGACIRQGLLVIWSNPKALFLFGAFIPQFVDTAQAVAPQVVLLGGTFMVIATLLDSVYALVAGRAGAWLSRRRVRWLEQGAGTCLVGGGVWLLLQRAPRP